MTPRPKGKGGRSPLGSATAAAAGVRSQTLLRQRRGTPPVPKAAAGYGGSRRPVEEAGCWPLLGRRPRQWLLQLLLRRPRRP